MCGERWRCRRVGDWRFLSGTVVAVLFQTMWLRGEKRELGIVGLPVAVLLATTVLMLGNTTPVQMVVPSYTAVRMERQVEKQAIRRAARARQQAVRIRRRYMLNTMYVLGPGEVVHPLKFASPV